MAQAGVRAPGIVEIITEIHKNNRRMKANLSLKNLSMEAIIVNKRSICLVASQTKINPMEKLEPDLRKQLAVKAMKYKSRSGDDFKTTCQLLATLIYDETKYFEIPQCEVFVPNPNALSDFARLEQFTTYLAFKAKQLEQLHMETDAQLPLANTENIPRSIFTSQLCQLRNLRVLNMVPLKCNTDSFLLIAASMLSLSNLYVTVEFTEYQNLRAGIEALSRLQNLHHFHFAPKFSDITQAEVELVDMCMCMMPALVTVGRNLVFSTTKIEMTSYLTTCYHSVRALHYHVQHQRVPTLEEFYTHNAYWTQETASVVPNLKRLSIIGDNQFVPDTLTHLSLYYTYNLKTVRAFTPNMRVLSLFNCDLSGVPFGGLMVACPNLDELNIIDCLLNWSNVSLAHDVCNSSPLRVLTFRGMQGVLVDGILSRLLHAPRLERVRIAVPSITITEVHQLVRQVRTKCILQQAKLLTFKGAGLEALVRAVQVFLPDAVHNGDIRI